MTTETKPRTLEEIEYDAPSNPIGCVREAYALGAASRASPDEGRAVEVDEAIDNFESAVRDNERGTDPRVPPMAVSILRNALRMIALGSRPAVDHTGRQPTNDRPHYLTAPWSPPPEDSGAREPVDPEEIMP